ncbi:VOC family protein [Desertihabitans brevis]|uniref:VOC family protein n=1 Tax=Desertihabitans brevis TaxID=2268447 RepID=A0A367Z065_9ACTN|nr:VOC family protein [Desertihabitans brevis]RCK71546.1 VOC family protein [Desertihabitans brevis]
MARLRDVVLDSVHPARLAHFWAGALDGYAVAPYDEAELARLRSTGVTSTEDDPTVLVEPSDGGPRLWCQRVEDREPAGGPGLHLDLVAADTAAEADRLVGLGASVLAHHDDHLVLADPEGHPFCLYPAG